MSGKLTIAVLLTGLIGAGAVLYWRQGTTNRLTAENAELRNQVSQLGSLQEANQLLTQQLQAALQNGQSNQQELLRLRGQSVRLRQLERENTQLKSQTDQLQRQVSEKARQQASAPEPKPPAPVPTNVTDLGALELSDGVAMRFDLGGGTNCVVTPAALPDGSVSTRLAVVLSNADGTATELGQGRVTSRPGQYFSISVSDRMIGLAVTLKSQ